MSTPPSDRKRQFLLRSAVITSAALLSFCKKVNDEPVVYANPKGPVYEPTLDASAPFDASVASPDAGSAPIQADPVDAAVVSLPDANPIIPPPIHTAPLHANPKGSLYDKGVKVPSKKTVSGQ